MSHLTQSFIDEMKEKLLEEKANLELELEDIKTHTELGADLDSEVQEIQLDEVNKDIASRLTEDLRKVNSALQKIVDGTYGVDGEGSDISEERLRIIPWADKAI